MAKVTRRESREIAFKILFGYSIANPSDMGEYFDLSCDSMEFEKNDFSYELYAKTLINVEDIDSTIEKYLNNWELDRLSKITLSILRLCTCELLYFDDIPKSVSMNEYIEISKKYDEEKSSSFVNGIINNIGKEINKK